MPIEKLHKLKLKKNLLILALIFGWVALIWFITMVKVNHGG
jgi:hypothetical protein